MYFYFAYYYDVDMYYWGSSDSFKSKILFLIKMTFVYFVVNFCVGIGGQYFSHHYIFAAPYFFGYYILSWDKNV